jgi:hypothetical protein
MLLGQLAWLASVVSAVAIVVSAIYASIQIRHNTRAVRASAFQQVVNSGLGRDKTLKVSILRVQA